MGQEPKIRETQASVPEAEALAQALAFICHVLEMKFDATNQQYSIVNLPFFLFVC